MTFSRAFRLLLGMMATVILVWSFCDFVRRSAVAYRALRDRPIVLTVLHWGDQAEDQIVEALARKFMDENPTINIVRINAGKAFDSKLKTMMAAGTPPDVFYLRPAELPELATMKLIAKLDSRFDGQPAQWRHDFFPLLLDAFHYNVKTGKVGASGSLYGIPKDFTTSVFYVNVDLFGKAGVPVPFGGWTWDEFEADMKKITALNGTPGFEGRSVYGGMFDISADSLRDILWTFGGEYFGPGGFRDVALESPASQAAMQLIYRTRLTDRTVYNATGIAKDAGQEFFNGNIGCTGPVGRWKSAFYKSAPFHWDIVPAPYKTAPVSLIYYNAWTMSSSTAHPDESFRLIKFLCGREGQVAQAHLGLAIPSLQSVAYSDDFLKPAGLPPVHTQIFLDQIKLARLQQLPRELEWSEIVEDSITKSIQLGQETTMQSARRIKTQWLAELDSPLRRQEWPPMPWNAILGFTAISIVTVIGLLMWLIRREHLGPLDRAQEHAGWAFILPWLIGFLLLTLGPMVASLLLSFSKWSAMVPIGTAQAVGITNYRQLLLDDPTFFQSLRVTACYVALAVPIGQFLALAVAMLMNSKARGITLFRTIYFVPSVISGVALAVLWLQIFNNDYGLLNQILRPLARLFGATPPDWFGKDARQWAIPAFVIMGLWSVGGGMIIYLAGLKGIPLSFYEAATIDGAGSARKFWNVTLPMLSPLIFYNVAMAVIGSFQVFTQAFVMTGPGPDNATLFYVLNLYRQAFEFHNMGYASAMAWVLFVIILAFTLVLFRSSRNLVHYEGLKG